MADDAQIRRRNLQRFMHAAGLTPTEMARRYYGHVSYWSNMRTDPNKPFGEKAARRLEEAAGLPRLWLDTMDADLDAAKQAAHRIGEPPAAWAPPGWPWSAELWKQVQAADEDQLEQAERILRALLDLPLQPPATS